MIYKLHQRKFPSNRPTPLCQYTHPEITVTLSADFVIIRIE
jgi:hypothetical protein